MCRIFKFPCDTLEEEEFVKISSDEEREAIKAQLKEQSEWFEDAPFDTEVKVG